MRDLGTGKIMGTNKGNPNWREDAVEAIIAKQKNSQRIKEAPGRIQGMFRIVCRDAWRDLIHEAAARHGISASSYARRALSLHLAADLDLNLREILWLCPELNPPKYNQVGNMRKGNSHDDGEGIEKWCPHPGCDGTHLR